MAERRMFAKTIIDSDAFLDMPLSSQALYFHLSMRADDDGFVNGAKKIKRTLGCSDDDFGLLLAKNFIIPFEGGVCVIKHWKIHNYIQKDRYKPTLYADLKDKLSLKNNGIYSMDTQCIQDVSNLETSCTPRLGKVREGKTISPDGFDLFWNSYPSKKSKQLAIKAFSKVKVDLQVLLSAIEVQKQSKQWRDGIIPHASTWLNQCRWEDELSDVKQVSNFDEMMRNAK